MEQHLILNLNKLPFRDFDSAARMRDLLQKESGNHYQVEQYQGHDDAEGFVVTRNAKSLKKSHDVEARQSYESANEVSDNPVQIYHPALRVYLLYAPILFAGAVFLFFPQDTWSLIFTVFEISILPTWINSEFLVRATKGVGGALFLYNSCYILYSYFVVTLMVDNQGVALKKGIIAQDIINIKFSEIKTIGLKRSVIERLLNIGTLEFSSSGSDGVDIRFSNILSPARVKSEIELRG